VTVLRSVLLFLLAALAEIGGAWLVWQGVREHRGLLWTGAGVVALGLYGFVATLQPDANFGRILAAYGGVFVAGSLAWGMVVDGFRPDRWDYLGAAICLVGVTVIMYAPRVGSGEAVLGHASALTTRSARRMLRLNRNTLAGSHRRLSSTSRCQSAAEYAARTPVRRRTVRLEEVQVGPPPSRAAASAMPPAAVQDVLDLGPTRRPGGGHPIAFRLYRASVRPIGPELRRRGGRAPRRDRRSSSAISGTSTTSSTSAPIAAGVTSGTRSQWPRKPSRVDRVGADRVQLAVTGRPQHVSTSGRPRRGAQDVDPPLAVGRIGPAPARPHGHQQPPAQAARGPSAAAEPPERHQPRPSRRGCSAAHAA
jgi:small multidrug resistance family-3 protein